MRKIILVNEVDEIKNVKCLKLPAAGEDVEIEKDGVIISMATVTNVRENKNWPGTYLYDCHLNSA